MTVICAPKCPVGDQALKTQYAALPYRFGYAGDLEILLVTTRESRRWVIPKGWPMKKRTPWRAAQREALEEAGVEGVIAKTHLGGYHYLKRGPNGEEWPCEVLVYPLEVRHELALWREGVQRSRGWFSSAEAMALVEEPDLKLLIGAFVPSAPSTALRGRRDHFQ
jgi:8-oxo-dGTP pyrophosphatase MutT (NUDIX family)